MGYYFLLLVIILAEGGAKHLVAHLQHVDPYLSSACSLVVSMLVRTSAGGAAAVRLAGGIPRLIALTQRTTSCDAEASMFVEVGPRAAGLLGTRNGSPQCTAALALE